jgi:hypothetical protein
MTENEILIDKACSVWHEWFKDEEHDYSEREDSDVEYFIGVLLYNQFAFEKALSTMKTMDVAYDFIQACEESYDEVRGILAQLKVHDDAEALAILQQHIQKSIDRYRVGGDLYLLNRLAGHINTLDKIYKDEIRAQEVDFERLAKQSTQIYK